MIYYHIISHNMSDVLYISTVAELLTERHLNTFQHHKPNYNLCNHTFKQSLGHMYMFSFS